MNIIKLLNRPTLFFDESLRGYMIRLSESNYNSFGTFKLYKAAELYNYNKPKNLMVLDSSTNLNKLAEMAGKEVIELMEVTFQVHLENDPLSIWKPIQNNLKHFGTSMYRSQICPQCLKEKAYLRKIWDITIVTTCHIHHCKLHDQCLKCNKTLSPYRKSILFCDCGFDLRGLPIVNSSTIQISELLNQKLFDLAPNNLEGSSFLQKYSFLSCLYLLLYFTGVVSNHFFNEKRTKYSKPLNDSKIPQLSQASYFIFQDWPQNFYCFLDAFRVTKGSQKGTSVIEVFGKFHSLIFNKLDSPVFKEILVKYIYYLTNYWDGGFCNKYSITDCNKNLLELLEVEENSLAILVNQVNQVSASVKRRNAYQHNNFAIVNTDELLITSIAVMKKLGIPIEQVDALRKHAIIHAIRGPGIDGYNKWLFSSKEIEILLTTLMDKTVYVSDEYNTKMINIKHAIKFFTTWSLTFCHLVQSILSGELKPYLNKHGDGLKEFRFIKEDVIKLIKKDRLSIKDISQEMGVSVNYVTSWIRKGFLKSSQLNPAVIVVNKDQYLFFKETYMTGIEILKHQNKIKSVESLIRVLNKKGIKPISGPQIDGGNGYLFKRDKEIYHWLKQIIG